MRPSNLGILAVLVAAAAACGQQANQATSALDVNGSSASGMPPYTVSVAVPGPLTFTVGGNPNMPFVVVEGAMADTANMVFPQIGQLDVGPTPSVVLDGYADPLNAVPILSGSGTAFARTDGAGTAVLDFCIPSTAPLGTPFRAWQVIVVDFTNPPFFSSFSAATEVTFASGGNLPPIAAAGADQTVVAGCTVMLDGTGSTDPEMDPITMYSWTQIGGSATVALSPNNQAAQPTFVAPNSPDVLTFALTASDAGGAGCVDTVTVTVNAAMQPYATGGSDVNSIWAARTCTNCHGSGGGLTLSGTAAANYQELMDPAQSSGMRVDVNNPSASLILQKPLGNLGHTGGPVFMSTADPDYQKILAWITEGACFN